MRGCVITISCSFQRMTVEVTYREKFNDHRLKGFIDPESESYRTISGFQYAKILWTPDTFFRNSVDEKAMGVTRLDNYARIYPNGDVQTSQRMMVSFRCPEMYKVANSTGKFSCTLQLASCKSYL